MIGTRRVLQLSAFLSVLSVSVAAAAPDPFNVKHHGSACTGKTPTSHGRLHFDTFGVHNDSTAGSATVSCPGGFLEAGAVGHVSVTTWHDHPTLNVSCTGFQTDNTGHILWSQTKTTSGLPNPAILFFQMPGNGYVYIECTLPAVTSGKASYVASISAVRTL